MLKKRTVLAILGLALSIAAVPSAFADEAGSDVLDKPAAQVSHSAWKESTALLKSQLETLRAEQKSLVTQIQGLHASSTSTRKELTKEEKAVLKASLRELDQQIKAQHTSIASLRTQKQALWAQVKAAKKAGDASSGVSALEQIISLKEQIIQAKQAILALQQSLQVTLTSGQ